MALGFPVLVSTSVFVFSLFDLRFSVFINKKADFLFIRFSLVSGLFASLVYRPHRFGLFSAVFRF